MSIARTCAIALALALCQTVEASEVRACAVRACRFGPHPAVHSKALAADLECSVDMQLSNSKLVEVSHAQAVHSCT